MSGSINPNMGGSIRAVSDSIDTDTVELQPVSTNPDHEAISIGPTTVDTEIVGIVVGSIVGSRCGAG